MKDVSVIIVNYNTKELMRNCLMSVFEHTNGIKFEVIVSDNGSTDGSIEMILSEFPQVILIENNNNFGFGAANNRGLKIADGKYIFYLNSDTILLNNAIKYFYDYFEKNGENENLGALGGYLLDSEQNEIHSGGKFPNYKNQVIYLYKMVLDSIGIKKLLEKIRFSKKDLSMQNKNIDYVTGADLFVKNNDFAFYDERFFMYYEEADLQFRMAKEGFVRKLIDGPQIIHLQGGSSTLQRKKYSFNTKSSIEFWTSCILFFNKNFSGSGLDTKIKKQINFVYHLPWNYFSKTKGYKTIKDL